MERADYTLFSETQSRLLVTINPENKERFEAILQGTQFAQIGTVTNSDNLIIKDNINVEIKDLDSAYKTTFKNY